MKTLHKEEVAGRLQARVLHEDRAVIVAREERIEPLVVSRPSGNDAVFARRQGDLRHPFGDELPAGFSRNDLVRKPVLQQ